MAEMISQNTLAALDIGETTAKLVVGTFINGEFKACGAFATHSQGISNGEVTSRGEVQKTILTLLEQAKSLHLNIKELIVVLPSTDMLVVSKRVKSYVPDKPISQQDIKTLNKTLTSDRLGTGELVVGIYPLQYYINGTAYGRDENNIVGIRANKIQLDAIILISHDKLARLIVDAIKDLEIGIVNVITSPVALANAILSDKERTNGITIVDIGGKTIGSSIFKSGLLCGYKQGNSGGGEIINKGLIEKFELDANQAEDVKLSYGQAIALEASDLDVYYNKNNDTYLKENEIASCIETSLENILSDVKDDVNYVAKNIRGPVILAGGVANTIGIKKKAAEWMDKEVRVRKLNVVGVSDQIYYPAVGAILAHIRQSNSNTKVKINVIDE